MYDFILNFFQSSALKIPVSTLQRKIAYWQTQGLIKESGSDR